MEQMFTDIIEKDEQIIKVYKPNKCKYWWSLYLTYLMAFVWMPLTSLLLGIFLPRKAWEAADAPNRFAMIIVSASIILVMALLILWLGSLNYKNKFYAYSNKRILIRSGIFGVDYKSLEYKSLTATIVNVTLLDKLVKKNTGSIMFGSPSSQITGIGMGQAGQYGINPYAFKHILKPYDTLKEIKEIISEKDNDKK